MYGCLIQAILQLLQQKLRYNHYSEMQAHHVDVFGLHGLQHQQASITHVRQRVHSLCTGSLVMTKCVCTSLCHLQLLSMAAVVCHVLPLVSVLVELRVVAPCPWQAPALALLLLVHLLQALGRVQLWHACLPCLLWYLPASRDNHRI